jgi:hypothetical protein
LTEAKLIAQTIAGALNPRSYIKAVGLDPFEWQDAALVPGIDRLMLLTARQSGKSTVVAGKAIHKAKHIAGSLSLIICPTQDQSKELMKKIEAFMLNDRDLPAMTHDATFEKEFVNGSRIIALPGSERSVRGYSGPSMIIVDEAARVLDETYLALRPMMTGAQTELVLMSTPFGKRGFFYRAWHHGTNWKKIMVTPKYRLEGNEIVPGLPEKEHQKKSLEKGVLAFYSPRHDKEFLREELENLGWWWFSQEYVCEFLDADSQLISSDDIEAAFTQIEPLFGSSDQADKEEGVTALF